MESIFIQSISSIMHWNSSMLYLFLFISAVFENLFPPIPGDTITIFGAFLVGIGKLDFLAVYTVTTIGSSVGFVLLFYAGTFLEREFFTNSRFRLFTNENILKAETWFRRYGYPVVLLNRFLPGIRSVISITAGISGMNGVSVFLLSLLSAMAWNFIWIYSGYTLGSNWETVYIEIKKLVRGYNIAALTLIVSLAALFITVKFLKRKKSPGSLE